LDEQRGNARWNDFGGLIPSIVKDRRTRSGDPSVESLPLSSGVI
jgi:hypothetical protein